MHPLEMVDKALTLPVGLTRSVLVSHNTDNVPVLRAALVPHKVRVNNDTSIPKEDRPNWKVFAEAVGLPQEWWMDDSLSEVVEVRELPVTYKGS